MSNAIDHLEVIYRNPFLFAPNLLSFFIELGHKPQGVLLAYLVTPLVTRPDSKKALTNINKRSSIFTFSHQRDRIYGLNTSANKYKPLTNLSLQYAIDNKWLSLDEDLSIKPLVASSDHIALIEKDRVACVKLARLLKPYEVPMIFRTLGVRNL